MLTTPKSNFKYLLNAIDSVINQTSEYQAIEDLLCRSIPRINNKNSGESIITTDDLEKGTEESIVNLQESCLSIQGPPGTGRRIDGQASPVGPGPRRSCSRQEGS